MLTLEELYLYTVCTGLLSCDRDELKTKILQCPEVAAYKNSNAALSTFANALYNTEYENYIVFLLIFSPRLSA